MGISFNPLIFSGLINVPGAGAVTWRGSVPTEGDLPASGNTLGDAIATEDFGKIFVWSGSPAKWHDTGITAATFGSTPNSDGYSLLLDDSDPLLRKDTLVLQPADSSNPGGVSTAAQNFAGDKTFDDDVIVAGSIDAQGGIDSSTTTLDIGATATTINIGNSGSTVTIAGTTLYENVTDLLVQDKTITINDGGATASAGDSGIEIEENSAITGYAKVSSDRNNWELKAPNQAGVAVIDPGTAGITLDQSSHDPVTLASVGSTPNADGATLTGQVLNLEPADSSNPGVVSTGAQNFAGNKTFDDDVIVSGSIDAQNGIDSTTGTLDIGATATTINIGNTGSVVTITGTTLYENVTDLLIQDKTITINDGGAVASAGNAGIEIEENNVITGYAEVSTDRNSWELKAPNQAGIVTISPGALGITLDQSSHDPVTLAAVGSTPNANGATLTGQILNLEAADATNPGVVSTNTQTFAGDKTFDDDVIVVGSVDAQNGIDSTTGILDLGLNTSAVNIGDATGTTDIVGTVTIEYNPADNNDWASPVPDDVIEALDQLADRFVEQDTVTKEPTGFPNRTDSTISFSDSVPARTFSISPTVTSFDFYVKGKKFTKTLTETIQIPNLAGDHYIYYDELGNLATTQVSSTSLFENNALVAVVYWNTDTNTSTYFAEERHGLTMDGATHSYLHTVFGTRYLRGLALQGFSVDGTGNLAADAQFTSDQGAVRDEDILVTILAQTQIPILYRQGQLWRKKAADSYPVIYSGTAGYTGANGILPYNQFTGGNWQLTEVSNNKFVLVHLFATNDINNGVVGIQGTAEYNDVTSARTAASTEITSLSGLPFVEFCPIGSVIFETAIGYTNAPKARVRSVNGGNYVDFRGTQLYTPAGNATTHSLLSGLANDDHIQYLLADGTRAMVGALNMSTHLINNVVDPSSAQDAATKNYVDNNVNPVLNYADQQIIYVSKNGSDLTGTGGQHKPFLTIQAAINAITDATASKKYIVRIAPGTYTETLTLKPYVNLQGYNKETVVISIPSSTSITLANRGRIWLEGISFIGAGSININTTALSGTTGTVIELRNCGISNTGAQKFTFVGNGPGRDYVQFRNTDSTQAVNISGASITIYESTLSNACALQSGGTVVNAYGELLDAFVHSSYIYGLSVIANTGHFVFFQGFGSTLDSTTVLNGSGLTANFDAITYPSTQSLLNTPTLVRTTKSEATNYNNVTSGLTATNDQAAIDELASKKANRYAGDIDRTSFSFVDNQSSPANVTNLAFSNAVVRGFDLQLTIVRGSLYAEYNIKGIQRGSSWEMSQEYVGDDTGVTLSITSAGQVQYTSTNTGTAGTILFRAIAV